MIPELAWLYSIQQFGIKPGLDNIRRLLREMQLPGSRQQFLHVAGTNGKGSVSAFMESILRASGARTGLFTSPHLVGFAERMRFCGEMPAMDEVGQGIAALRAVVSGWDPHPTFFELTLALALDWMDRRGAEVVVLETGMGGRLDATNTITPVVSVITPVAMDHQQYLGDTLAAIAAEKGGIIKPGIPVVSAPQAPEVEQVLRTIAARVGAPFSMVTEPRDDALPLAGTHQRWNAALAVAALRAAGFHVPEATIRSGLAQTKWPARFQRLDDRHLVIDGAHNPHGIATAVETWKQCFGNERATVIFGSVAAKEFAASLGLLRAIAQRFLLVTVPNPRAIPGTELAAALPAGLTTVCPDLPSALASAASFPERSLLCGSLYLCGQALALSGSASYEPSEQ